MQNDNKLAALIIRNIVDLEHSLKFLNEEIEPKLAEAIFDIIEDGREVGTWFIDDRTDLGSWFCPESWRIGPDTKPDACMWFQIDTPGDDPWESWVGTFAGGSGAASTAALMVRYARMGKRQWQELRNSVPDAMAAIRAVGFTIDGDQIYYSLPLDSEALSEASEQDDLRQALGRIEELADALDKAMPAFMDLHAAQAKLIADE